MTKKVCGRVVCCVVVGASIASGMSCASPASAPPAPTAADAKKFLDDANETMKRLYIAQNQAGWIAQTFITDDTEAISARVNLEVTGAVARFAKESTRSTNSRFLSTSAAISTFSSFRLSWPLRHIRRKPKS